MTHGSHARRGHALVAALVLTLALAPSAGAADQQVTATQGNTFSPQTVTVDQGDSVTWTNGGGFHNVHFDDNSFDEPPNVSLPPWTVSRTFTAPGSFTYYCEAHSFIGMTGTVKVAPVEAAAPTATGPAGTAPVSGQAVTPAACASKRRFTIRIRGVDRVRVKSIRVEFNGKELPVRSQTIDGRRRRTADIDMRGLPRGSYSVAITVTSADGKVLRGARTYRTCAAKLTSTGLPRL